MTKTNKILILVAIVAVILIGIGYASLTDQMLTITGAISAQASQDDFKVIFQGNGQAGQSSITTVNVDATKVNDITANFKVTGLTKEGDTVSATYTIENASNGITATNLRVDSGTTGSNEYISYSVGNFSATELAPGETATVTVTATVLKTPLTAQSLDVDITILASPKEVEEART